VADLLTAARARELADRLKIVTADGATSATAIDTVVALRSHADALDSGATTQPSTVAWLAARVGATVTVAAVYAIYKAKLVLVAPDGVVLESERKGVNVTYMVALHGSSSLVYTVNVTEGKAS
jgi:hypothetical protein